MISMMRNLEDLSLEENMSLELMLNDIDDEEFGGLEFGGELEYVEGEIELVEEIVVVDVVMNEEVDNVEQ